MDLPSEFNRNSYSLYCAELMANMKDVPSTERMVLCSQQWKLLSQKEKDAYHKKCDQVRRQGRALAILNLCLGVPSMRFAPARLLLFDYMCLGHPLATCADSSGLLSAIFGE